MNTAVISTKYQVVIPKEIRKKLNIHAGQKVQFISYDNRLEIIPIKHLKDLVGICEGMDTSFERDDEDRL